MRQLNFRWKLVLLGALVLLVGGGWWLQRVQADPSTIPSLPNAATLFQPVQSQLKAAQVPLRLPTYIPSSGQAQTEPLPVYAVVESVRSGRYSVVLGYSPDCDGATVCRLGAVMGETQPTQSASDQYAQTDYLYPGRRSDEPVASVELANQITGVFLPWRCATNCTDAQIVWDEDGFRYSVGIKLGERASLIQMANSAIEGAGR